MNMRILVLIIQIIFVYLSYIYGQQFTFSNNPPAPSRYLVPGAFVVPPNQPQPQSKRLLQNPDNENSAIRIRKPIGRSRPAVSPPLVSLVPLEPEFLPSSTSSRLLSSVQSSSLSPRPIIENEDESETEDDSLIVSTNSPNTTPPKTFVPPIHFRSTKPQFFSNTNIIDEEETDFRTTKGQASPSLPTTAQENPQPFQRKQHVPRIPNYKQQLPQSEIVENKIIRQYEKPIKTKVISEKRARKPVAQNLRRYREDNPDGSITWGFENDDGSYKEETIGNDCVTRGKYGYIDPDGVRREYSYSSGLLCDKNKLEQNEEENSPAGYVDYSSNKVVLPNGDSVDLDAMVKNRARKPVSKFRNQP